MNDRALRIGEVAAAAGVNIETLRYYERRGLLAAPRRTASGYRAYSPDAVEHVRAIKWIQGLGFKLAEIKDIMQIWGAHVRGRGTVVRSLARTKIHEIDETIERLKTVRESLVAVSTCRCHGACPIIEEGLCVQEPTERQRRSV